MMKSVTMGCNVDDEGGEDGDDDDDRCDDRSYER